MKGFKTAVFCLIFTATAYGKIFYSWQLGTFNSFKEAEKFVAKLPKNLKKEVFIYKTQSGLITVRYKLADKVKKLINFKPVLINAGIKNPYIAPTIKKKVKKIEELTAEEKIYSIQLGTFDSVDKAKKFIQSLPDSLKKETFLYKTDKGFITVRYGIAPTVKNLREKAKFLKNCGISNYLLVPTDPKKLKNSNNYQTSQRKITKDKREEIFKLSLKIFLANRELKKALKVAEIGTRNYPEKKFWWEQLAQIATWTGNTDTALKAYSTLYFKFKDEKVFEKLYSIATATGKTELVLKIIENEAKNGRKVVTYKKLFSLFQKEGESEKAIKLAERLYKNNPEIIREIAKIHWFYGNKEKALENLEHLKELNAFTYKDAITEAKIYISQKKFQKALHILKKFIPKAPESDNEFWRFLSSLAWITGDYKTSAKAAKILMDTGKGAPYDYSLLILYLSEKNPEEALFYTLKAYKKTKMEDFILNFISIAAQIGKWQKIVNFINSLPERERKNILSQEYPFSVYILALSKTGNRHKAMELIVNRLTSSPNKELLKTYINFLIEINTPESRKELLNVLKKFKNYENEIPEIFANAYLYLQNGKKALTAFKKIEKTDYQTLLLKADILEVYGKVEEANKIRFLIYRKLHKSENKLIENPQSLLAYLRVASLYRSHYLKLLNRYKQNIPENTYKELLYSHMMKIGEDEKVEYKVQKRKEKVSPWLQLSLTLRESNTEKIKKILHRYGETLPVRDRVYAFEKIKATGNAYNAAFEKLDQNPYDSLLYKQFRDLTVAYKNSYNLSSFFTLSQDYNQLTNIFNYKKYVKNNTYLKISLENIQLYGKENYTYLKNRNKLEISVLKLLDRSKLSASSTIFKNVKEKIGFKLEYSHKFKRNIITDLGFYLKEPADESVYLISGGYKTGITASIQYPVSSRFYTSSEIKSFDYYTVTDEKIGKVTILNLSGYYKLRIGYPDFTFKSYIRKTFFSENHKNTLIDRFTIYPPADALPDSSFEVGAGFEFGYENRNSFVRTWRPFFNTCISYNSRYGTGISIGGGYGGSIFGRDNLNLETGLTINPESPADRTINFGVNYKRWF
ncbi:tetratricopeptide repeat protein [Desulfurobacterium atlanticum]|uniref:Tetratricopeptide repeat-containing protein n=1 Tax=Desulfurobacterium atlanticum TaxID=240169 RepID=A0A238XW22_9BACT|nr:tetratricopeptide repeat protein [Desulfurobacterium atlanticum]SNR62554.1 Tetratricopeptide repeat-containing protein [Desulfurobacterium atlanticum]